MFRKSIGILIVLMLALSLLPAGALGAELPERDALPLSGSAEGDGLGIISKDIRSAADEGENQPLSTEGNGDLPSRYDSRDYGYVTPVKTQGYGDCWAHATCACIETYMIKHGMKLEPMEGNYLVMFSK